MSNASVLVSDRVLVRNVGGNTTYARNIVNGLSELGSRVGLAGPPAFNNAGLRAGANAVFEGLMMSRRAQREGYDVLFYPADTGPWRRTPTPSVVTVHGMAALHVAGIRSPLAERIWMARVARAVHSADRVVTVSNSSADDLMRHFEMGPDKISVIPHGIDHDRFHSRPQPWPDDAPNVPQDYVLFLGNLEPRKNLLPLIRAFADERLRSAGLSLVIAGKPAWDAKETLNEIDAHTNVHHLGWVADDVRLSLMQHARAFAFPSLYEGFGFPVLEAMAAGCPVVCTTNGSLKEVAADAALTIGDPTPGKLADALVRVHNDSILRQELRDKGLARAQKFSWAASFEAHQELFNGVADQ